MRPETQFVPGGLRRKSIAPQRLVDDWSLAGCETMEWEGETRPCMGGIPLLAKLGKGGMGYVYYGVVPATGEEVAVKVLPRAMQEEHASAVARFLREARLAAEIDSDFVVRVKRVSHDEKTGAHYIVMECVKGVSAGKWMEDLAVASERATEADALDAIIAATRGLAAAHDHDIVHRDLKPDNVLLPTDDDGIVYCAEGKLADLGLARPQDDDENLTQTSTALGTAGFMAPEQLEDAKNVQPPADVFGMGATLYALLCGDAPFAAPSSIKAIMNTIANKYPPIAERRPDVSEKTAALITKCLARSPADRYAHAGLLLADLLEARAALGD